MSTKQLNTWINKELPKLKKEYGIHSGRKARSQAEKVAYLVKRSFLKNVEHSNSNNLQSAAHLIASYVYFHAYNLGLRCNLQENVSINIIDKDIEPQSTDRLGEQILEALQ